MTDWIMIVITLIYVVATVFICYFNYKSARASSDQLEEIKTQFNVLNKPMIAAYPLKRYNDDFCIEVKNIGNKSAFEIKLEFPQKNMLKSLEVNLSNFQIRVENAGIEMVPGQSFYYVVDRPGIEKNAFQTFLNMGTIYVNITFKDKEENIYLTTQLVDSSIINI